MPRDDAIDAVIAAAIGAQPPRAGSLIVTLFGDSVSQYGNSVWLGSVIEVLEPFGLNARQIRTAVFRLVRDGWLSCAKQGRRSFYSFTDFGVRQYAKTARRIYAAHAAPWNGRWTLVLPAFVDTATRDILKRELSWLGFGAIASGVLAHPNANADTLAETLQELDLADAVVVMHATAADADAPPTLERLALEVWNLDDLARRYERFITCFKPALKALEARKTRQPAQLFALQTILIHEYRRILLKTTDLPDELLPAGWPGRSAMALAAGIYAHTRAPSGDFVQQRMVGPDGMLAAAAKTYAERFQPRA